MTRALAGCRDILFTPADEIAPRDRSRHAQENALSLYMLRGFLPGDQAGLIRRDATGDWRLPCENLGTDAMAALRQGVAVEADHMAYGDIERAWTRFTAQGFAQLNDQALLKPRLADFAEATHFAQWPREILEESIVKQKTRVIYRSPADYVPQIRVSQTHDDRRGDLTTPVRETEVAVQRQDGSGEWDFFVYGRDGLPSAFSEFPSGYKPVPSICMGCHYDSRRRAMDRIFVDP